MALFSIFLGISVLINTGITAHYWLALFSVNSDISGSVSSPGATEAKPHMMPVKPMIPALAGVIRTFPTFKAMVNKQK